MLNETAHLSYLMKANTLIVYQIQENVKHAVLNLNGIAEEEETPFFIMNEKIVIDNWII